MSDTLRNLRNLHFRFSNSTVTTDRLISESENLIALYTAMRETQSASQCMSIIFLYVKTHCRGSMYKTICDYVATDIFDQSASRQAEMSEHINDLELFEESGVVLPDWLTQVKLYGSDWKSLVQSTAFPKVSKLISMCAAIGLCDLSKFDVTVGSIRLFSIGAEKRHVSASDLISAVIDTSLYFIEGAYTVFQTGSLTHFLYSDDEIRIAENEYFEVIDLAIHAKAGNLQKFASMAENDYSLKLDEVVTKFETLVKTCSNSFEKKVLQDRYSTLRKLRIDFATMRVDGKLREAPYGIFIKGASGVGKSTVASLLMRIILKSNNFSAADDRIITVNEDDKFWSTYKSHINGIFIDDIGNTKPDFVEKSPASKVIDIVNNVPVYVNMAEVDMKGRVALEPKALVLTSNLVMQKIAGTYSAEPFSIVRRATRHYDIKVKPEFAMDGGRLDSRKVVAKYGEIPPIADIWNIDIFEPSDQAERNMLKPIKLGASIHDAIIDVIESSRSHFCNQSFLINMNSDLDKKLDFCSACSLPKPMCKCELLPEFGIAPLRQNIVNRRAALEARYSSFVATPLSNWINYLPDCIFDHRYFQIYCAYLHRADLLRVATKYKYTIGSLLTITLPFWWYYPCIYVIIFLSVIYLYAKLIWNERQRLVKIYRDERGVMPTLAARVRNNYKAILFNSCAAVGVLYTLLKTYRSSRKLLAEGNLQPTCKQDIVERDSEENTWVKIPISSLPVSDASKTAVSTQVSNSVARNLSTMRIQQDGKTRTCNVFFISSTFAVIPEHMFFQDEFEATFYRGLVGPVNQFKSPISKILSYKIPDQDLRIVQILGAPSYRDLLKFVSPDQYRGGPAHMIYREINGELKKCSTILTCGLIAPTGVPSYQGYNYTLPVKTFPGMCIGTWISESQPRIIGFHLAGSGAGCTGAAGFVTADQITTAISTISSQVGTFQSASAGTLRTESLGINFFEKPELHSKSPVNFLEGNPNVTVYGSVAGRATYHSTVEDSIITKEVHDVCGAPNKWGKPNFHPWKPWRDTLVHACQPSTGVPFNLLQKAVKDYEAPLLRQLAAFPYMKETIKPLANVEIVSGIDGMRFIDKMPPNTSVGYPLGGPKKDHLVALDPEEYPDQACPMELDDIFWKEYALLEDAYLKGERAYPVFKAALKDEPTLLTKDKVRVFQCAPLSLQIGLRKYYLPLARFVSLNPILSECAVGINAQGPEWEQLSNYMTKYGKDRILAGDYSKYDIRMPAQLTKVAFSVLMDIARASDNYTSRDIQIMEGLASDVCNPLIAYNGDLLEFLGINPSGQNLTVYINNIVNSLLLRCAFFEFYVKDLNTAPTFQSVVACGMYGDDVKGSVKEGHDYFNHISFATFLAKYDMKFTMPDKTSVPTKYMSDSDADFLKRKNVFVPEVGMHMGALDEESIFKSLHSHKASNILSKQELAMGNIDGALREWFAHGSDVYELRRKQMREVADKAGIAYGCRDLNISFDERVKMFQDTYNLEPPLKPESGEISSEELTKEEMDHKAAELNRILYAKAINEIPFKCIAMDTAVVAQPLGEIDLVFQSSFKHNINDHRSKILHVYVIVEIKTIVYEHNFWNSRTKGQKQLRKYWRMFRILVPEAIIISVMLTPHGYETYCITSGAKDILPHKMVAKLPFSI